MQEIRQRDRSQFSWLSKKVGYELTNESLKELDDFKNKYAISVWQEHVSLFSSVYYKHNLSSKLKRHELYDDEKTQSQMKLN